MQRTLPILTAFGLSLGLVSCFGGAEPAPEQPIVDTYQPAWKLTLQSDCGGEAVDCVGYYGFTVDADGKFQAGPAPQGQIEAGTLQPAEFKEIEKFVAEINLAQLRGETCESRDYSYSADKITLSRKDGSQGLIISTKEFDLCFQSATAEKAEALHNAIRNLAVKYYPQPFPDACADSAMDVQEQYAALQTCQKDSDCAFLTWDYHAIDKGVDQFVATDTCLAVRPMVVGNAKAVAKARDGLIDALNRTHNEVCGDRAYRSQCTSWQGFSAAEAKAVCRQNVCQVAK